MVYDVGAHGNVGQVGCNPSNSAEEIETSPDDSGGGQFAGIITWSGSTYGLIGADPNSYGGGAGWGPPPCPPAEPTVQSAKSLITNGAHDPVAGDPGPGGSGCPTNNSGGQWVSFVVIPIQTSINDFCTTYNLSNAQNAWLQQNPAVFTALNTYVTNNNLTILDNTDFLNYGVNYLMDNTGINVNDFINSFNPSLTFNIDDPYSTNPADYYKLDANTVAAYPRFAKLVNQLPQYLAANPSVLAAIMYYTGYTKAQIMQMVAPGQGPTIIVKEMPGILGHYTATDNYNVQIIPKPYAVEISASFVRGLEAANLKQTQEATAFLLAVTIFHETVHLGRNMNNLPDGSYEYGWGFENLAFKVIVTSDNAAHLLNYNFILN